MGIRTTLSKIPILGDVFFLSATPLNAIPLSVTPLKKDKRIMYKKKMLSYCLKCGENTKGISPLVSEAIKSGTKCAVCNTKKARFIKK